MAARMMTRCIAVAFAAMTVAASSARAGESFNVRFSWKLKGEYAPFYLAQQKGMFAKEGLTVRLGEGAGSEAALGSMLQGNEDVVIIPGIYALSAISKGMPVKLVSLIQPVAPAGIVSHPEKPIATPQDLEGKSLAATVGDTTMDYLKVLCSQNHIDCAKIKIVMMNVQARLPQFMSKQVDGMSTYWNIDLPQLEYTSKEKFVLLDVGKYGERVPGLSVVTSDAAIARNPDKLKRFLRAMNQGFDAMSADVAAATQALQNAWEGGPPQAVVEAQVKLSNQTFPIILGKPRGWVEDKVIASALDLLKESGQISEAKPLNTYFTNNLLSN
jgi:NitT/TauT family transport system substrate-binding protein